MMKLRTERKIDSLLDGGSRYCGVAAAIVGSAIVGGVVSSRSTSNAVDAQTASADRADATTRDSMAMQERLANQARADQEPWRLKGIEALNKLSAAPDFNANSMLTEPGYQFGLSEGMKGLTNSAAARGGLLSGAALKASTRYAQDYAGTKYGEAFGRDAINKNRLASLAGVGQTAATTNGATSMQLGNQLAAGGQSIAQNQLGVGNARASGYLAQGNALTGALNQGVSAWNNYNRPPNDYGLGNNPYAGYDAAGNGGWGIE